MAFTDAQKMAIRKYLGVPFGFYNLTTRLESMMNLVGDNATDSAQVIAWITRLDAIDAALTGASATSTATYGALKKVDEVEFYEPSDGASSAAGSIGLVDQGRTLIGRIARALGVSDVLPHEDYFSAGRSIGFAF